MPKKDAKDETYDAAEAQHRFEAALRGARIAGPQHIESVTPKWTRPQRKKRKKAQSRGAPRSRESK